MGFTGNAEGRGTCQTPQRENKGKMWVLLQDDWLLQKANAKGEKVEGLF